MINTKVLVPEFDKNQLNFLWGCGKLNDSSFNLLDCENGFQFIDSLPVKANFIDSVCCAGNNLFGITGNFTKKNTEKISKFSFFFFYLSIVETF